MINNCKSIREELIDKYKNNEFVIDSVNNYKTVEIIDACFQCDDTKIFDNKSVCDDCWYESVYEPLIYNRKFGKQYDKCLETLVNNPISRQAVIGMLTPKNFYSDGHQICTIGMNVILRENDNEGYTMDYIVYMRSNNALRFIDDLRWQTKIRSKLIKDLLINNINVNKVNNIKWHATSLHIYEQNFDLLENG